jgi:CPA2 family monovalent cation:H+ antiporter-2
VFGLALSVASTVVLVRVLADNGALQSTTGRIAIGWLVMEDIFTIFVLVLIPVIFDTAGGDQTQSLPRGCAAKGGPWSMATPITARCWSRPAFWAHRV